MASWTLRRFINSVLDRNRNQNNTEWVVDQLKEDARTNKSKFYTSPKRSSVMEDSSAAASPQPHMLPGETVVTKAHNVIRFQPYSEHKHGISGVLFCTNFKVSFVAPDEKYTKGSSSHRNKLIGEQDVALNSIDAVYQASDVETKLRVSSSKRKKLQQGSAINGTVKNLEIHCKDFRIHTFSFKFSSKEESKMMANAIVHYAFPCCLELLFAFEYKTEPPRLEPKQPHRGVAVPTVRWRQVEDWQRELERLHVIGYKAILCNPSFRLSESLPECFVVPDSLSHVDITGACPHFVDYRCPTWCYSHSNGSALVRMAYLTTETTQVQVEKIMLDAIQKSHPTKTPPFVFDLTRDLPPIRDLQTSYEKLREMCMPVTLKELKDSDQKWYGGLHSTRWLQHVANCLNAAAQTSNIIRDKRTVVLKELECRDLGAVVAALAQILMDPHYRTLQGFQSLVEKEFVLMGHRFVDRLGLLANPDAEQSPIMLLFLDCVWQLTVQFPSAFQFSQLYLTILWDSVCLGLFDNFIFNSCRERMMASRRFSIYTPSDTTPNLISVWDWTLQFDRDDMSLFNNPLYLARTELKSDLAGVRFAEAASARLTGRIQNGRGDPPNGVYARSLHPPVSSESLLGVDPETRVLHPVAKAPLMKFWSHCYLRWLAPIQIMTGGAPLEYLQQCVLVEEIMCLQHKISTLQACTRFDKSARKNSELIFSAVNTPQTPRSRHNWSNAVNSSFPYCPAVSAGHVTYFGTPLKVFLEKSLVLDSDEELSDGDPTSG